MHDGRGAPKSRRARGSSWSCNKLSIVPWLSLTSTSDAPAAKAPRIAALASAVISTWARGYPVPPRMLWSNVATPATPSMSTEMKTLMACGPSCRDGRHLGCEPAAEVHAVDRPGRVAGEVAAHSLRRAVRDDVLVAGTGEQRDRHRWLLLGLLLALLAQDGEHLRL